MSVSAKEFDPNIATVVATMKQEVSITWLNLGSFLTTFKQTL
jgi:hypothetical protein